MSPYIKFVASLTKYLSKIIFNKIVIVVGTTIRSASEFLLTNIAMGAWKINLIV
jgi:hypothetical protein